MLIRLGTRPLAHPPGGLWTCAILPEPTTACQCFSGFKNPINPLLAGFDGFCVSIRDVGREYTGKIKRKNPAWPVRAFCAKPLFFKPRRSGRASGEMLVRSKTLAGEPARPCLPLPIHSKEHAFSGKRLISLKEWKPGCFRLAKPAGFLAGPGIPDPQEWNHEALIAGRINVPAMNLHISPQGRALSRVTHTRVPSSSDDCISIVPPMASVMSLAE